MPYQRIKFYQTGSFAVGNRLLTEEQRSVQSDAGRSNALTCGHRACQGCGEALGARYALDAVHRATGLTHTDSFFVLLNGDTLTELNDLWTKLADGATIIQTLAPASWAPAYGMLTDRFGVTWILGLTPRS